MGVEETGSINAFPLSSNSNGLAGQSRRVVIRSYSGTDVITGANWNADCVGSQSQMGNVQYLLDTGKIYCGFKLLLSVYCIAFFRWLELILQTKKQQIVSVKRFSFLVFKLHGKKLNRFPYFFVQGIRKKLDNDCFCICPMSMKPKKCVTPHTCEIHIMWSKLYCFHKTGHLGRLLKLESWISGYAASQKLFKVLLGHTII